MPITDPVPDEAIVEGFKSLRDHDPGHDHNHAAHHPPKPPPRLLHGENEEPNDHIHEGASPAAAGGTATYHHTDTKNEHTKIIVERNEVETISSRQKNYYQQPTPTPPILSPFPDVDIFLLNDAQSQPPQSVPTPFHMEKSIVEILPTGQHRDQKNVVADKRAAVPPGEEGKNYSDLKTTTMTKPPENYENQSYYHHIKHSDDSASGEKPQPSTRGQERGKFIAQWTPPNQVNSLHVEAYEKFGRDNGQIGAGEGGTLIEERRQRGASNWFRPSVWLNHKQYKVSINLSTDWRYQASFFAKVILTKAIQLLLINLWILLVALLSEVREVVVHYHNWMYFPLGLFLLILIIVRIISKSKSGWYPLLPLSVLIVVTMLIAYALAAVTFTYGAYCIPMITVTLFLTCLTMPFVPYMTQSAATQPVVTRTGGVLVLIYAVFILVVAAYSQQIADMTQFATLVWFPGLLMAEIVLWVTIYEIQRVLKGLCFNVSERRWCFTALYV